MADQGVDVTVILGFLYLGSKKTARNKAWIRLNVRYILNCTPTRDADPVAGVANYWEKEGLAKYMRLPVFDSAGEELKGHVDRACAFIEEARYHGGVLVHCNKGVSRSVAIVAAYLMKARGLSLEEALSTVKRKRPQAAPNAGFVRQLQRLDRECKQQRAAKGDGPGQSRKRGRVAGPSLPEGAKRKATIGPTLPPADGKAGAAAPSGPIGPSLPPAAQRGKGSQPAAPIGPSLPPSAKGPVSRVREPPSIASDAASGGQGEQGSSEPRADDSAAIGPGLPPWMKPSPASEDGGGSGDAEGVSARGGKGSSNGTGPPAPAEQRSDA